MLDRNGVAELRVATDVLESTPERSRSCEQAGGASADADHEEEPRAPQEGPVGAQELPAADAGMAEMLSKASMGLPQDSMSFVLTLTDEDAHSTRLPAAKTKQDILRSIGADENCRFNLEDVLVVQGSGAFFALKIQQAKDKKQLGKFAREAESLHKLKGSPFIVQIIDHAANEETLLLLILMELGACDLHSFFEKSLADLAVSDVCRIWQSLVRAVDAAHKQGMIHRDIKPQVSIRFSSYHPVVRVYNPSLLSCL